MVNEPIDASNAGADLAFLEFDSAKADAVDARGTPPVDARRTMWRVVRLYAWLATLLVAVWGLWLLTAWIYKQPPAKPKSPLEQAFLQLKRGLSEEEVVAIIDQYDPPLSFAPSVRSGKTGILEGPYVATDDAKGNRIVRWRWVGFYNSAWNGSWGDELSLCFENWCLNEAYYTDWWGKFGTERELQGNTSEK